MFLKKIFITITKNIIRDFLFKLHAPLLHFDYNLKEKRRIIQNKKCFNANIYNGVFVTIAYILKIIKKRVLTSLNLYDTKEMLNKINNWYGSIRQTSNATHQM